MSNGTVAAMVWAALALHVIAGAAAIRTGSARPMIPLLNALAGACVLIYWGGRWYDVVFRGVTWSGRDQIVPLYALLVCLVAGLSLSGRVPGVAVNWIAFALDAVVLLLAALFFTFFRMNRLF